MADSAAWPSTRRWLAVGALASVAVSAVLALAWRESDRAAPPFAHAPHGVSAHPAPLSMSASRVSTSRLATSQVPPAPASPVAPSFEVVRLASDGSAVIAGRAAPGEQVTVREGGRAIAHGQADAQGTFVIVPAAPLPPGAGELTLSARSGQASAEGVGAEDIGAEGVVVVVPAREPSPAEPGDSGTPLAVLVGPDAPRVLQLPGVARPGHLGLRSLDYDPHGGTRFAGTAPPGAPVRLYVDNNPAGEATSGTDGLWSLRPTSPLLPGQHRLRLDQLGADGRVAARVALSFLHVEPAARNIPPGGVIVEPGASLWRIVRASDGAGVRHLVIFRANRRQVRRPSRIYPGQVLGVPSAGTQEEASTGALEPPR